MNGKSNEIHDDSIALIRVKVPAASHMHMDMDNAHCPAPAKPAQLAKLTKPFFCVIDQF
jgi:hypothetical protein